jgi:xyloglucan-specific endo-beta-1,4-glucanase
MLTLALLSAALAAAPALAVPSPQGVTISNSATQAPIKMCGTAQNVVLTDTPWIVYNMFYNSAQTKGSMCTAYDSVSTGSDGNKKIKWSAVTDIGYVKATYVHSNFMITKVCMILSLT